MVTPNLLLRLSILTFNDVARLKGFQRRFSWKEISDPVYGYVYFNKEVEEKIVNHVILQRLRYIMQLQTAHLVYPGAVHTRFQHSLGVMHLGGLMAEDIVRKILLYYGEEYLDGCDPLTLIQAVRLAGLLHDSGHACFSHTFEEVIIMGGRNIPDTVANHERVGYVLFNEMIREGLNALEKDYGLCGLSDIVGEILSDREPSKPILKIAKWIIKDSLYPADILDFLRRDSYYTGTHEYGYIDYERLYKNTYPYFDGDKVFLLLDRNTWGEFRAYMFAKANMFEHVYYHSVNRAFDLLLKDILLQLDEKYGLTQAVIDVANGDPRRYLTLTDVKMYAILMDEAFEGKGALSELARKLIVDRKPDWKRIGREYILTGYRGLKALKHLLRLMFDRDFRENVRRAIHENLFDKLKSRGFGEGDLWVDVLDISPVPRSMLIPSGDGGGVPLVLYMGKRKEKEIAVDQEVNLIKEGLPLAIVFRVYVKRGLHRLELERVVTETLGKSVEETLQIEQEVDEYTRIFDEAAKYGEELGKKRITM